MWVKPVPGRTVRDPHSMALLPAEGREVNDSDPFWLRRVRDGDVTVEPTQAQAHRRPAPAVQREA
jgi:hypothetical protein